MTSPSDRPFWRERTLSGAQLVVVDDRYTWAWVGDPPLEVGDAVALPGNPWTRDMPYRGVVTSVGSDYLGPIRRITGRCGLDDLPTFDQLTLW